MYLDRPLKKFLSRLCASLLLGLSLTGCTSWRTAAEFENWTLYVEDDAEVDVGRYSSTFDLAFGAVETHFGPFTDTVSVHAITGSVALDSGNRGTITGEEDAVEYVEGIGATLVPAFHARGGGGLFEPSGIFVATLATGTAVHELVHARISELGLDLPLWFEEGLAHLLGDGIERDGRWVMDGFAFWPWLELQANPPSDEELRELFTLSAKREHSVRDNVLLRFVGWAILFDCLQECDGFEWQLWLDEFINSEDRFTWARTRLDRTMEESTMLDWMLRIEDEDPAVRLTTARGCWKLGDERIVKLLLDQLEVEEDDEVKVCLVVNAMASLGRGDISSRVERRLWSNGLRALRDVELPVKDEEGAARDLYRSYVRWGRRRGRQRSFDRLERYWGE
jgi:hypothetical protein